MTNSNDYRSGFFVFLYPSKNTECKNGVESYQSLLVSTNESITKFYPKHLEDFIRTLRKLEDTDFTRELEERYLGRVSTLKNDS